MTAAVALLRSVVPPFARKSIASPLIVRQTSIAVSTVSLPLCTARTPSNSARR
jgi:hypothetical protein